MNNKKQKPIGRASAEPKTGATAKIGRTVYSLHFRFAEKGRGSVEDKIIAAAKRETLAEKNDGIKTGSS